MQKKLLIVGDLGFAEIACEYFTHDSVYSVAGFAVERAYLKRDELFGRPIVAFEDVERRFPPSEHDAYVAVTFTRLNRVRARFYQAVKAKGYRAARYVSSKAFVWRNVDIGEHCFIFEGNVLQCGSRIGNNVVLWSGNHIGHGAVVDDHCFLSSHVVVSRACRIGTSSFLGVNSTLADGVTVGRDSVISAGAVVLQDVAERQIMRGNPAVHAGVDSFRVFGVKDVGRS